MSAQTPDEIPTTLVAISELSAWHSLPAHARNCLLRQIERDLPDTQGAVIVEVDAHELEADEADVVGECIAYVVLSSHHMYAACFVPCPPGTRLH